MSFPVYYPLTSLYFAQLEGNVPLQVRKGFIKFRYFNVGRVNIEMPFTLGPNDLVSGVTFFFFFVYFCARVMFPKRQRARRSKGRRLAKRGEVGEVGERLQRLFASEERL